MRPKTKIRAAGRKGRGVFAATNIKKGEIIEKSPVIYFNKIDRGIISLTKLAAYYFKVRNTRSSWETGGAIALGHASLYNHSYDENASYYVDSKTVTVKAIKNIKKNEEITIDYGYDPRDY